MSEEIVVVKLDLGKTPEERIQEYLEKKDKITTKRIEEAIKSKKKIDEAKKAVIEKNNAKTEYLESMFKRMISSHEGLTKKDVLEEMRSMGIVNSSSGMTLKVKSEFKNFVDTSAFYLDVSKTKFKAIRIED